MHPTALLPLLAQGLFAAALAAFNIYLFKGLCVKHGRLYDIPQGRKQHEHPTPSVGGASFALAFFAAVSFAFGVDTPQLWPFLLPAAGLTVLGVADDEWDLKPLTKLFLQLAWLAISLHYSMSLAKWHSVLPYLTLVPSGSFLATFGMTVAVVIGAGFFVNAFNMTDGIDGQAGSVAFTSLFFCGVCAYLSGADIQFKLAALLCCALLGFLAWNLRAPWRARAAVFMGDAGSLMLGFSLVWFALTLTQVRGVPLLLGFWLLAFPLLDAVFVAVRRLRKGKNPLKADRTHFHHLMQVRGLSVGQTVLSASAMVCLFALIGIALWMSKASLFTQSAAALAAALGYFGAMSIFWKQQGTSNA